MSSNILFYCNFGFISCKMTLTQCYYFWVLLHFSEWAIRWRKSKDIFCSFVHSLMDPLRRLPRACPMSSAPTGAKDTMGIKGNQVFFLMMFAFWCFPVLFLAGLEFCILILPFLRIIKIFSYSKSYSSRVELNHLGEGTCLIRESAIFSNGNLALCLITEMLQCGLISQKNRDP